VDLATALLDQMALRPSSWAPQSEWEARTIRDMLMEDDSPRRQRRLCCIEAHVRLNLGIQPMLYFDWNYVDWEAVFLFVLKVAVTLLPLLLLFA
jgi:hypothetical protein